MENLRISNVVYGTLAVNGTFTVPSNGRRKFIRFAIGTAANGAIGGRASIFADAISDANFIGGMNINARPWYDLDLGIHGNIVQGRFVIRLDTVSGATTVTVSALEAY